MNLPFPAALDARLAQAVMPIPVDGLGQLAAINASPAVCAAVAGLVGAAGGFFGARGALKGKGLPKKKFQQQIAMYAVGATTLSAVVGYFLCRRPTAPAAPPPSSPQRPLLRYPLVQPGPEPLR